MIVHFIIGICTLLCVMFGDRYMDSTDKNASNPMAWQMMSLAVRPNTTNFHLTAYQAVVEDDLSLCAGNPNCLKDAIRIQSMLCTVDVCTSTSNIKNPLDCYNELLRGDLDAMASAICASIESPGPETRKELLRQFSNPEVTLDFLIEDEAYFLALKVSGEACIKHIRDYVGPYGPGWTFQWYRSIAGCRILSQEKSLEELECDFSFWTVGDCPLIRDEEFRKACNKDGRALSLDKQNQ